jgi:hypothetical protein
MSEVARHAVVGPNARIALYYAPPADSSWWRAGCEWLGRDPESARVYHRPAPRELAALGLGVRGLTRAPRRYGWHATLVAPFRCAECATPLDVLVAAREWASRIKPFSMPVAVAEMGRFVALRPSATQDDQAVRDIAASALHALGSVRAMPSEAERERRIVEGMSDQQIAMLREWGYPYVLDEYRFHMTLSDSLDDASARQAIASHWTERVETLGLLPLHGAALFAEPQPGAPFMLWQRLPFDTAQDPA